MEIAGYCGQGEPITVVEVCVAATRSYISAEVHTRPWCRARCKVRSYAVGTALVQHRSINQALHIKTKAKESLIREKM